MGDGTFGRQAAFDQVAGCRRLDHTFGAGATGILRTDGDDDPQLRGHDVQPFGAIFADPVHLSAATGAFQAVGFDHLFDPRQVLGQIAMIAPDGATCGKLRGGLFVLLRLDLRHRCFKILERQLALVLAQLFRPLSMHHLIQLGHEMLQALVDLLESVPLAQHRQNSVALVFGDGRKVDGRGAGHGPVLPRSGTDGLRLKPPSHSATAGRRASKDRTRRQSRPADRASNCARFSVIVPFRIAGHVNALSSSRL